MTTQPPPLATAADIAANIAAVQERIQRAAERAGRNPADVTLVGVSKTFPAEAVHLAHAAGLRHFGENFVQESEEKLPACAALTPRPTWHFIGHLQTNKVRTVLGLFDLIESVDSLHLAEAIAKRAGEHPARVLLEVNVAAEASKFGFTLAEVPGAVQALRGQPGIEVAGLMTVAPDAPDPELVRPVFRQLRQLGNELGLTEFSMGMTNDFEVAIEEGATIIRLGRAIFGPRAKKVQA